MKKLLVAAMGIAAAYGAFADPFSVGKRFEDLTVDDTVTTNELNEAAGGTFWTDPVSATNTYTVKAMDAYTGSRPEFFDVAPTKALEVKTTFGSPLKFNFKEGATQELGADGLYFDSLVKFTVCDAAPEDKDAYSGAKIMLWLQSDDDTVTNVMIRAGYLTYSAGTVSSVATNYTCGTVDGDFAESWHRVTIKAIADITADDGVPGFVVFIDGEMVIVPLAANYNVWGDGFPARNDKAKYWENRKALFPSIVQSADKKLFSAVEFDGTGFLNDVTVTETAPDFAEDKVVETPEVSVTINGTPLVGTLKFANAVAAVNDADYGEAQNPSATITLSKDAVITEPLEFTANATITLDFAGFVLTNAQAEAMITNSATALIITDSSETVGGIVCGEGAGAALVQTATGSLIINGGFFDGQVDLNAAQDVVVNGGSFKDDTDLESGVTESGTWLAPGKTLQENQETGLYDVVDEEPVTKYTVTVDPGSNVSIAVTLNGEPVETLASYEVNADDDVTVTYTAVAGYVLTGGTAVYEFVDINENMSTTAPTAALAVAQIGGTKYASLAAAVAAAQAGDTVTVLADCEIATPVSFTKNITVSNDYTIAANVNYALCIGATVTFEGSGKIQRRSDISGSAFCVGANEATRGAITVGTSGTLYFNSGTICGGNGGNMIKLEYGTVYMNGGDLTGGKRGIKADADAGSYTSTIIINGGTISNNTDCAVMASAKSATGTATVTINGGVIEGALVYDEKVGTYSITIPGTSTAKFDADRTAFCAEGYETVLKDGWYQVQKKPTIDPASDTPAEVPGTGEEDAQAIADSVPVTIPEAAKTYTTAEAYQANFDKTATYNSESGKWEVTAKIAATVEATAAETAAEILTEESTTGKVTVPAGLYYKVTRMINLGTPINEPAIKGISDGQGVSVEKPGSTQGFIQVEIGTGSID